MTAAAPTRAETPIRGPQAPWPRVRGVHAVGARDRIRENHGCVPYPVPMRGARRPVTVKRMDRRFVCQQCGMKWFIPADQPARADLTTCSGCGGDLIAFGRLARREPPFAEPLVTRPARDESARI